VAFGKHNYHIGAGTIGIVLCFFGSDFYALSALATGVNAAGVEVLHDSLMNLKEAYFALKKAIRDTAPELRATYANLKELKERALKLKKTAEAAIADGKVDTEEQKELIRQAEENVNAAKLIYAQIAAEYSQITGKIEPALLYRIGQEIYMTSMSALACGANSFARNASQGFSIGSIIGGTLESLIKSNSKVLEGWAKYGEDRVDEYSHDAGSLLSQNLSPAQAVDFLAGYFKWLGMGAGVYLAWSYKTFAPTLSCAMMGGKLVTHSIEMVVDPWLIYLNLEPYTMSKNRQMVSFFQTSLIATGFLYQTGSILKGKKAPLGFFKHILVPLLEVEKLAETLVVK